MCILFFNAKTAPKPQEYALILINNRDEVYSRPTKVAAQWENCSNVIGGRDAMPGKEGGTWLAMTKQCRIAVLLNILQPVSSEMPNAKGRGSLVTDFVQGTQDPKRYLDKIATEGKLYNNFNLVLIETSPPFSTFNIGHYSNLSKDAPTFLNPGLHSFGNCELSSLWKKISHGRKLFQSVISKHPDTSTKQQCIDDLLGILNDKTNLGHDPQLEKQGYGRNEDFLHNLSSLCVENMKYNYGTRTNTVILVDGVGNVDYVERTMAEPIDVNSPEWKTSHYNFTLEKKQC